MNIFESPQTKTSEKEKEKKFSVADFIKEKIDKVRKIAKEKGLEKFIPKGKQSVKVLALTLMLGAQGLEAKNMEMPENDENEDESIEHLVNFDMDRLYNEELEKLSNDITAHFKSLEQPDATYNYKEIGDKFENDFQGSLPDSPGEIGDIEINSNIHHITRENNEKYEESLGLRTEYRNVEESEVNGTGIILKGEAMGNTKEEAIMSALHEMSDQYLTFVESIQGRVKQEDDEGYTEKYVDASYISSDNYFENVHVVTIGQDDEGRWHAVVVGEVGEVVEK